MGDPVHGGCTWRASPQVDVIYGGRDLAPAGWEFAPGAAGTRFVFKLTNFVFK